MKKKILCFAAAASLLLLSGCGAAAAATADDAPAVTGTAVETVAVSRQSIAAESTVSGSVAAGNEVAVYPALQAEVLTVPVEVGDAVQAGDILCTLDVSSYQDQLTTLQTSLSTTQQSYTSQKALFAEQVAQYQTNLNNTQALFEIGAASQTEVDGARLQLLSAQTTQQTTLAQLSSTITDLLTKMTPLQDTISKGVMRATLSGTVTAVNVEVGGYAAMSMSAATISEDGFRQVKVSVSEALLPKLALGDRVRVGVGSTGHDFDAQISQIAPSANAQTKLYAVTIDIPTGVDVTAGMFASVTFYTDSSADAVVIPTEAILTRGDAQYVYTVTDHTAHAVQITTGLIGDGVTEVTSGLSGGETLVTVGQSYLSDGEAVRDVGA